jgi:hypothetical protein
MNNYIFYFPAETQRRREDPEIKNTLRLSVSARGLEKLSYNHLEAVLKVLKVVPGGRNMDSRVRGNDRARCGHSRARGSPSFVSPDTRTFKTAS